MTNFLQSAQMQLWIERFLTPIDDPGSRLFHLNIAFTFALIGIWALFFRGGEKFSVRKSLFRGRYWWNKSTKVDYQLYLLNSLLKVFLFLPLLGFGFFFSQKTARILLWIFGDFPAIEATALKLGLFTVLAFAFDDFLRFFHHYLMHKVPFLWRLHSVHHSARVLTPVTLYRAHPLESAIATVRNSISLGVCTGVFLFVFDGRFNVLTFFGVNVLGFLFNLLGANLRHSHIPLTFGWLENVFISPKQHQIHHSRNPAHFDKNFGVSLSLWDRLCGSLVFSRGSGKIRVGLSGARAASFSRQLLGNPANMDFFPSIEKLRFILERKPMKATILSLLLLPLFSFASSQTTETVVQSYTKGAYAGYSAAAREAKVLQASIERFLQSPSAVGLEEAKAQWIKAREVYSPTEVYRFYEGPIDNEDGLEGFINAWPLDEAYIDYVEGGGTGGIINDPSQYPEITKELLMELNEKEGETNITTGFHAIEFLLWGQDLDENGPGQRPYTDYVSAENSGRRADFLRAAAALLVEHLETVRDGWAPEGEYASEFLQAGRESLRKILIGAFRLAGDELAHERMFVAYEAMAQEDEQSCFSDTTHLDILNNFLGVKRVLVTDGVLALLESQNKAQARSLQLLLVNAEIAVRAVPQPFDRAIFSEEGREKILAAVNALEDLADGIQAAAEILGFTLE